MELILLGTGCGIPQKERSSPGSLLKSGKLNILFDSGPGILAQLLKIKLTYTDIDYIIYTHLHVDHINELSAILFACKYPAIPRKKDLTLIGPPNLSSFYHKLNELYKNQIDAVHYNIYIKELKEEQTYDLKDLQIITQSLSHPELSFAYKIINKEEGKTLVYAGDTQICEGLINFLKDADVAILECSFPLQVEGHLCPDDIQTLLEKTNCKHIILTHFYPVWDKKKLQRLKYLDKRVTVGYDLLKVSI